jgi:adenylyltransferase/sulfurtransferase
MLTAEQARRYSRQIALPEIGPQGQLRLAQGRVLLAGVGGLGSVAALYLAAAGVGHIRLVDRDRVSLENLNRQILHATPDLGRLKIESATPKLSALNPGCRIEAIHANIERGNAADLLDGCSPIVDATDNRETRQVLNRVSVQQRVPFVYGGIDGWEGMASTFVPGRTACFNCLFPPREDAPENGPPPVLGPTAGLVGSLQSLETLRLLLGIPPRLAGRLLCFSGASMEFRSVAIEPNPRCPVCGPREDRA